MSLETYLAEVRELFLTSEADLEMSPGRGSDSAESLAHFHVPKLLAIIELQSAFIDDAIEGLATLGDAYQAKQVIDRIVGGQPCQLTTDA